MVSDLGLTKSTINPAMFFKTNRELGGLAGTYVDDSLLAGTKEFARLTENTLQRFESSERICEKFTFSGIEMKSVK